nr:transmembrane protein 45B-like isoform X1 [Cherax quadricarinatus]XP_053630224.1 transmembrane protein 45B-like isoform X1 [Cherax quadricarinatus]
MGTFIGHVVPGAFLSLFSLWWIYNIFKKFFLSQRAVGVRDGGSGRYCYRSTCTFNSSCCPKLPVEGILKVVFVAVAMTGELSTAFVDGVFVHFNNAQHMTIYFFFGLNGAMDIVTFYGGSIPQDLDYLSAILAFCVEALVFTYHLHGRTPMDVQVHMFLVYVVGGCILAIALEMYHKRSVLPALARTYLTLLQGTWFVQMGFILYHPIGEAWNQEDDKQMMIVTLILCWHSAAIFVLMVIAGGLILLRVRTLSPITVYHSLHPLTRQSSNISGRLSKLDTEQVRHIIADSEEEDV